jgi:hypothetical protein
MRHQVTFQPDLRRVLENRLEFFDDVFRALILDDPAVDAVTRIV